LPDRVARTSWSVSTLQEQTIIFAKAQPRIGITCNYLHNAGDEAVQEEILVLSGSNLPTGKLIGRWKWIFTKNYEQELRS
jgi:hypothetical protein